MRTPPARHDYENRDAYGTPRRRCASCGGTIPFARNDGASFCRRACKQRAYRRRKRYGLQENGAPKVLA